MPSPVTSLVEDPELVLKRRAQIVAAATTLFAERGFNRTTIKDVARLAGISSGLVYQYVREKEDVLLLVLLDILDAYAREIPLALEGVEGPLERLAAAVEAYCRVIDRRRAAAVLAYRSTRSLSPERRELIQNREIETNELIGAAVADCRRAGLIAAEGTDVLVYQIVLVAHGWALKHWYFRSRLTLDAYISQSLGILFGGALTDKGRTRWSAIAAGEPKP